LAKAAINRSCPRIWRVSWPEREGLGQGCRNENVQDVAPQWWRAALHRLRNAATDLLPSIHMASLFTSPRAAALLWPACIGLTAGLYYQHKTAGTDQPALSAKVNQLSNALHGMTLKLDEQRLVNSSLEQELSVAVAEATGYSNMVSKASAELAKVNQAKHNSEAQSPLADSRLADLENERDGLSARLDDLTGAMAKLDGDLAETKRKLEASEGDRGALLDFGLMTSHCFESRCGN
jgi:hypothetical protein